jgi:hypothetical protein
VDNKSGQGKKYEAGPLFAPDPGTASAQISAHSGDQLDSCHKLRRRSFGHHKQKERPPGINERTPDLDELPIKE